MTEPEFLAFVAAVRKAAVRRIAPRMGDHAEDIFQDAVMSFLQPKDGKPEYEGFGRGPFRENFYRRLHDRMVDYVRAKEKGAWKVQSPLFDSDFRESVEGADALYERLDDVANLAFWRLTTLQLEALDLFFGHGLTQQEIAEAWTVKQQTVQEHLAKALRLVLTGGTPATSVEQARWEAQQQYVEALRLEVAVSPAALLQSLVQQLALARRPLAIDPGDSGLD